MRNTLAVAAAVLLLACGLTGPVQAQPTEGPPQEHPEETAVDEYGTAIEHDEHGEAAAHDGEGAHSGHHDRSHLKNEFAVFLGATDEEGHATQFTWGFDYKRRVADRVAVGAFMDHAGGDLRNSLVGALVVWWPVGNLELYAGPGIEFHDGRNQDGDGGDGGHDGHDEEGHGGPDANATYFAFRIGAGWDFHIGQNYGIVPTVALDLVDGEQVWVYGIAATYGW